MPILLLAVLALCLWTVPLTAQPETEPASPPDAEEPKASEQPAEDPASAKEPGWFDKQFAQEADLPAPQLISAPNGFFRARVPAKLEGAVEAVSETSRYLKLGIGTSVPVECWIHEEELDLASSLVINTDSVFQRLEELYEGGLEERRLSSLDAGVWDSHLYLSADWLYRVAGKEGPLVGQAKHRIAERGPVTVYCLHNELGYTKTFTEVVRALVESLDHRSRDPDEPFYEETFRMVMGEQTVGVSQSGFQRDEEGDIEHLGRTFLLIPTGPDGLQANDLYDIEWSSPNGALINAISVEGKNGEIQTNLRVDPGEDGSWLVHGMFQGKDLEATFEAPDLSSAVGEMLALRELMRSGRKTVEVPRWGTSSDPTAPEVFKFTAVERARKVGALGSVRAESGSVQATFTVDARGSVRTMDLVHGPLILHVERIHASGSPPRP